MRHRKKYVLPALALLCAGVALVTVQRARAAETGDVYAILYKDGTLVFQHGNTPESGRDVKETYAVDMTGSYNWNHSIGGPTVPWYFARSSVKSVEFADTISPAFTAYWFYFCENLKQINKIKNLNTSKVTDMGGMFYGCTGLTALDVSGFDTSNVTDRHVPNCQAFSEHSR